MPCQEIFDKQPKKYKNKIIGETKNIVSIEAGATDYWKKYVGRNGISFA